MPARCCPECFDDPYLREIIIPPRSSGRGRCDYCGSRPVDLVNPQELALYFELLITVYELDPNGKLLVEWMKDDWQLFGHPRMDIPGAKNLLADILDDGEVVRQTFSPSSKYTSDEFERWEALRTELMYKNRYFPDTQIPQERMKQELLPYLIAKDLPGVWFRARIRAGDTTYPISEMREPPARLVSHGRANPAGIPCLYLAENTETAVSEVRPHTGEAVCVARFEVPASISAIDLRRPSKLISPFGLEDVTQIGEMRLALGFLERLGEELTRPVVPQGAAIDYVPSQYLCEFIKKCGYDGVIYRSSVSDGMNLALFDPAKAEGHDVSLYTIRRVTVTIDAA
jgi:hypothetical protein